MIAKRRGHKGHFRSLGERFRSSFRRACMFVGTAGVLISSGEMKAAKTSSDGVTAPILTQHFRPDFNLATRGDVFQTASFTKAQDKINAEEQKEIADLRADFARTDLGKELLQFIDQEGIEIARKSVLDSSKTDLGQYSRATQKIYVSRKYTRSVQLMTLAHEARHAWQEKMIGYTALQAKALSPHQQLSLIHFIEIDAFSFSSYYMADRIAKGLPTDFKIEERMTPTVDFAFEYAHVIKSNKEFNRTRYRISMFQRHAKELPSYYAENCFKSFGKFLDYYEGLLAEVEESKRAGFPAAGKATVQHVSNQLSNLPTDKEFYKNLRKLGGVNLTDTSLTSLTGEDDFFLIKFYTTLPFSRNLIKNDELSAEYAALKKRYTDFQNRLATLRQDLGLETPKQISKTAVIAVSSRK